MTILTYIHIINFDSFVNFIVNMVCAVEDFILHECYYTS